MPLGYSNKNNPQIKEYYQTQADIIGIFWQFHKERLRKDMSFAYMLGKYATYVPFDAQVRAETVVAEGKLYQPIHDFQLHTRFTMNSSWIQFLKSLGVNKFGDESIQVIIKNEYPDRYKDDYVLDLINKAQALGEDLSEVLPREDLTIEEINRKGIDTGTQATVQLKGVFQDNFKPETAVLLSKTELNSIYQTGLGIGLVDEQDEFRGPPTYHLFDTSPLGLNRKMLQEMGLRNTLGCPASMRISQQTETFLRDRGVMLTAPTMLEDFAQILGEQFDQSVDKWYRKLSSFDRVRLIDPENKKILDGEIYRTYIEAQACPYGRSKERRG